jgi:type IV fimbrial biogenesis protein FimT
VRSRFSPASSSGFTLVELLVVIAVAAILATLAVPSLRATMQNNQLDTASNLFIAALATARSEAVRAPETQICVFNPLNGSSWASGWAVVSETPVNPPCPLLPGTAGTTPLQSPAALPGQMTMFGGAKDGSASANGPFSFDPMGRLVTVQGTTTATSLIFVFCADGTTLAGKSRAVIVSPSGRASAAHIATTGANVGIPVDDTGTPIGSCTAP